MRLSDSISITTLPSVNDPPAEESDITIDLIAPKPSSLSQYNQQQELLQPEIYEQNLPPKINPLLIGPLILLNLPVESRHNYTKDTEKNSQISEENTYILYRPDPTENQELVDMLPPPESQDEPNYYMLKPRKSKKFSETKEKKSIKMKEINAIKQRIAKNEDELKAEPTILTKTPFSDSQNILISAKLTNESVQRNARNAERRSSSEVEETDELDFPQTSGPATRIDFQMHGN